MMDNFDAYIARKLKTGLARYATPADGRRRLLRAALLSSANRRLVVPFAFYTDPTNQNTYWKIDWTRRLFHWQAMYPFEAGVGGFRMVV